MKVGFLVQCLLVLFNSNQAWNILTDFSNPLYNFTKILLSETELFHADWWTDGRTVRP
jgi:hypothetical protein